MTMNTNYRNGLVAALSILIFNLLFAIAVSAQAPTSIAGKTFGVEITGGDGFVFANSGFFLFVPANSGNGYQIINPDNSINTGTYSSYVASGATATATFSQSGITINGKFVFANSFSGTNSLTAPLYGGYQSGDFIMFTNPVPSSISGQNFYVSIQAGDGEFANTGDFIFSTASSGNAYTITAIGGGENDGGTYSYSRLNTSCGSIALTDSQGISSTVYVAFTNSVSGGYYLTSPYGEQIGNVTLLNTQAPKSIAGNTFIAAVTSGTPPFADSGYLLFLPANSGNNYQIIGLGDITNGSGTYTYLTSGSSITANLHDSINGSFTGSFFYFTPLLGSYALSAGTNIQTGNFAMLTNPVPNSIAGQGFYVAVTNGSAPFAASGSFTFTTAASGNSYKITAVSGGFINSTGTYSYSKLNASCGGIQLTDSVTGVSTAYVALSNSVSGGYALTQPSSGGFQIGLVTLLNTAVAITSPTTASSYTTTSSSVNLGGTASDNFGIAQVIWSNNRGGSGTATDTTTWTANGIGLQSGTNVITVTAYNTVSNTAQATLTVIYNPPALGIVHQSNNIVLAWPTSAAGFILEYATNLPTTNWFMDTSSPYIVNGQYTVTNTVSTGTRFYRLAH
jgi:hypothetical protein